MYRLGLIALLFLTTTSLAVGNIAAKQKPSAGTILVAVYVDRNENGTRDRGEPLTKWPVALSKVEDDTIVWTEYGSTSPLPAAWTVGPGRYWAEAAMPPADSNWYPTVEPWVEVTVAAGQPATAVEFGFNRSHVKVR